MALVERRGDAQRVKDRRCSLQDSTFGHGHVGVAESETETVPFRIPYDSKRSLGGQLGFLGVEFRVRMLLAWDALEDG